MTPIHLAVPEKRCGLTLAFAFSTAAEKEARLAAARAAPTMRGEQRGLTGGRSGDRLKVKKAAHSETFCGARTL